MGGEYCIFIMAIVGVNIVRAPVPKDGDSNKNEDGENIQVSALTVEERRKLASKRRESEFFSGKDFLTDGHYKRVAKRNATQAARRQAVLSSLKSIYETSQEMPLQTSENLGDKKDMLMVYHRSMAGKTKIVGTTVFVFNKNGVAGTAKGNLADYRSLLKRPGYVKHPRPVTKTVVKQPIVVDVVETQPIVAEAPSIEHIEDDEDEYEYEEIDFFKYTKVPLQKALTKAGVDFKTPDKKSVLVDKLEKAWEDDDLQEIIYDSLNPEED